MSDPPPAGGCLEVLLLFGLFGCAVMGPAVITAAFGAILGLLSALAAVAAWFRWGPPAIPGLVPGLMLMGVLVANLYVIGLCAIVIIGLDPGYFSGCVSPSLRR